MNSFKIKVSTWIHLKYEFISYMNWCKNNPIHSPLFLNISFSNIQSSLFFFIGSIISRACIHIIHRIIKSTHTWGKMCCVSCSCQLDWIYEFIHSKNSDEAKVSVSVNMKTFTIWIHIIYESIYKIAAINPLTPCLFTVTATTEDTVAANVAGAMSQQEHQRGLELLLHQMSPLPRLPWYFPGCKRIEL